MRRYQRTVLGRACLALAVVFLLPCFRQGSINLLPVFLQFMAVASVAGGFLLLEKRPDPPPPQPLPPYLQRKQDRWEQGLPSSSDEGATVHKGPRR